MPVNEPGNPQSDRPPESGRSNEPVQAAREQAIDLQALAEKIYELLKQEARLERERSGRS